MVPQSQTRKKKNSSKVNLIISFTFHGILVGVLVYFAAREGWLGKTIKKIAVEMVKEKPKEKPKEPEKPKEIEPPKVEAPKVVEAPKAAPRVAPPPTTVATAPPAAAPPAAAAPSFNFEGGKEVRTVSSPNELYKSQIESLVRSKWERPPDLDDRSFVAEVEVTVDKTGKIGNPVWKKNSGDKKWDQSVTTALASARALTKGPPSNFPPSVIVRFDVQETENIAP